MYSHDRVAATYAAHISDEYFDGNEQPRLCSRAFPIADLESSRIDAATNSTSDYSHARFAVAPSDLADDAYNTYLQPLDKTVACISSATEQGLSVAETSSISPWSTWNLASSGTSSLDFQYGSAFTSIAPDMGNDCPWSGICSDRHEEVYGFSYELDIPTFIAQIAPSTTTTYTAIPYPPSESPTDAPFDWGKGGSTYYRDDSKELLPCSLSPSENFELFEFYSTPQFHHVKHDQIFRDETELETQRHPTHLAHHFGEHLHASMEFNQRDEASKRIKTQQRHSGTEILPIDTMGEDSIQDMSWRCDAVLKRSSHLKSSDSLLAEIGEIPTPESNTCSFATPTTAHSKASSSHLRKRKLHDCPVPTCTKQFTVNYDLCRHLKTIHMEPEEGGYMCAFEGCPKADKIWTRLDSFRKHVKRHSGVHVNDLVLQSSRSRPSTDAKFPFSVTTPEIMVQRGLTKTNVRSQDNGRDP
ncbi:hypothetical protein P153DRAFT_358622 [Dothidotthia symphoricarpi CBS 119687]|uniref:C2H2-type domain-containing protein n=1 Tax=Dothidotthia symphoricarpi CBS 119687 TaxID=1392245 RepID=A0A6A6A9B4_9PLEO|nr:uncharacterized protein P153DRAFT_358622 [Dothidotthia symphoricarpi CBS 119687]KAF2127783.1 hypothetical protein P153DRAFT_358622 [Dothidotthia symphoricarpi CBS 119687]